MTQNLASLSKPKLIEMINNLKTENNILKQMHDLMKQTNDRVEKLEREQNRNFQYQRRNTIEITGIPSTVRQADLEKEVVKIYEAAGVTVSGNQLDSSQIQGCHRIGKKGVTICKFVNRKFAYEGIYSGKNLKDANIYGENSRVYINNSFCDEYRHLNYLIRTAKREGKLFRWKIKHGINYVQMTEEDEFEEIGHKSDLLKMQIIDSV